MRRRKLPRRKLKAVAPPLLILGTALCLLTYREGRQAREKSPPSQKEPAPVSQEQRPPPAPQAQEPAWPRAAPFDLLAKIEPALAPAAAGLYFGDLSAQRQAALELSSRFVASNTLTGLCPEAGDALWLLTAAVGDRRAAKTVLHLLYKDLALLSGLEDYEKDDFIGTLKDPWPIYVSLAVSNAPHVHESRRMFQHMQRLLRRRAKTLTAWIQENDPELRFAPAFLLRLNAYEALVPYLRELPAEARAAPALLFPEKRGDLVDLTADQIQNIFDTLAADPEARAALEQFVEGCLTQVGLVSGPVRDKIAVLVHLNWSRLTPELREEAGFILGPPSEEGAVPALRVPLPYAAWPSAQWRFTMRFADAADRGDWLRYFLSKGYKAEPSDEETTVVSRQAAGGPRVVIAAQVYESLDTGMMVGAELKRFQADIARDMAQPEIQGIFIRAHAQFPRTAAFKKRKVSSKLWYDGSCRGAWDLSPISRLCPDCILIGNVGSGRAGVNDPVIRALLEGLGRREPWGRIEARIKAAAPRYHARILGPWSTPYSGELRRLGKTRRPMKRRKPRGPTIFSGPSEKPASSKPGNQLAPER